MAERKNVVITGSTKGIGKGMALEFLKRGHNVVISSRGQAAVDQAVADLQQTADDAGAKLAGVPCDVAQFDQVQKLWDQAVAALGSVDIFINNAGITNSGMPIAHLPPEQFDTVVHTNLTGLYFCSQVVLEGMQAQGHGAYYTFEGFGSNGMHNPSSHVYGSTKNALRYFTKCLVEETKDGPVLVGYMSPGIVLTDLSLKDRPNMPPEVWQNVKRVYNILADRVETVTPYLVEGVLNNTKHGGRVEWLTRRKSLWRFLKSRFVTRNLFDDWQEEAA